jgi:hypothetical protein
MKTFTPTRPLVRVAIAAIAVAAALSTSAFIVGLAHAYVLEGQHNANAQELVVATVAR